MKSDIDAILSNSKNLLTADKKITKLKKDNLKKYIKVNRREPNIKIKLFENLLEKFLKQM